MGEKVLRLFGNQIGQNYWFYNVNLKKMVLNFTKVLCPSKKFVYKYTSGSK